VDNAGSGAGRARRDWQAFLVGDPDIRELEEVVIYCPECARREFGPVYVGTGSLKAG
jgi:hypothetical protein